MKLFIFLLFFFAFYRLQAQPEANCHKTQLLLSYPKNPGAKVFRLDSNVVGYVSEMAIDIDGSPQAYNPQDTGLDALASAGGAAHLSRSVIVFTDNKPFIQTATDPFPGYFLSQTSLQDKHFATTDHRRYVNADSIPYIALPFNMFKNAHLGDIAFVKNKKTGKTALAIVADAGDNKHIGEGSVALANELGIQLSFSRRKHQIIGCNAVNGTIAYVVFNNSGTGKPLTLPEIKDKASLITQDKMDEYMNCLLEE